jgi:hypothetical protein
MTMRPVTLSTACTPMMFTKATTHTRASFTPYSAKKGRVPINCSRELQARTA